MGYNNRYKALSWGINASRKLSSTGLSQNNYQLTFNFPLGRADSTYTPQMRLDFTRDSNGHNGQQTTVSGTAGSESQYSYAVTGMHSNTGGTASSSVADTFALVAGGAQVSSYQGGWLTASAMRRYRTSTRIRSMRSASIRKARRLMLSLKIPPSAW